jgi:hypothetical protein
VFNFQKDQKPQAFSTKTWLTSGDWSKMESAHQRAQKLGILNGQEHRNHNIYYKTQFDIGK